MKNKPKNIPTYYNFPGTKIFRDTTALPFADGGPLNDRNINGKLLQSTYASALGNMFKYGGFGEDQGVADYANSVYASELGNYYGNGGYTVTRSNDRKGKTHKVVRNSDGKTEYYGSDMKNQPNNKKVKEAAEARHSAQGNFQNPFFKAYWDATWKYGGEMIKRADGSYSQKGLWDNIRANAGSGKRPTKEMLAQERKINKQYKEGGPLLTNLTPQEEKQFQKFYQSLPDNLMQDDSTYDIRGYWDSEGRPTEFNYLQPKEKDGYYHAYSINQNTGEYLKSPAHETFQHAVDEDRKIGYRPITNVYGRNIATENLSIIEPETQSFLRNTEGPINYKTGGQFPRPYNLPEDSFKQGGNNLHNSIYASSPAQYPAVYKYGGSFEMPRQQMYMPLDNVERYGGQQQNAKFFSADGENHKVYLKTSPTGIGEGIKGHIMVNHPTEDKGKWDTIDLTEKAGAKTVAQGVAATKKWHAENPNQYRKGGSVFYATNTPQLEGEGKDLTYPENAYIYAAGGDLQNNIFKQGGTMNFKSKGAYQNWLAYGHASGEFAKTPGNQPVSIKGKSHKVEHAFGGNMYAAGGSFNNPGFKSLPPAVQAKIRANAQYGGQMYADGGAMGQLTEFNEGGRHEENPLGGIPQGIAPDGRVNLVEQGETKLDSANYIFSDTLKVDKAAVEQFGLNKSDIGKTFAQVSKKLNRPTSRRENDTIEQVAVKRDLDSLMEAQEDYKQRDLEKDMAMMMQKHPEAMQAMMQQQSVQPMGMPQGQPVDASQIPPEALAQMPEAQMGQPVMAYGGGMYKCGGKMYNLGGHMYYGGGTFDPTIVNTYGSMVTGAPTGTTGDGGFRDLSGGTMGAVSDTAASGATSAAAQAGAKEAGTSGGGIGGAIGKAAISGLSAAGTAYGAGKMQEQAQSATANQNSGTAAGIKSGLTTAVSAINPVVGGLIGLGQGIGNEQRMKWEEVDPQTGELKNQKKAEEGYVLGHFFDPVGSAIEDWSNPNLNFGQKLASTLGFSALVRKDYAKGLEKQAVENLGIRPEIEFRDRGAAAETSAMYSGYEDALEKQRQENPNAIQSKYGGKQASWHNYPAIYPTYPNNAGPMGMGLGTNLYPLGGPLDGDPVKTTTGAEVTVQPKPAIATYQFDPSQIDTGGLTYEQWYAKELKEYNNNPKDRRGIPSHGAGEGGWNPMPEEVRLQEIARLEGLPKNQITPDNVALYNNLLANKVYVGDMLSKDASLYNPETGLGSWIMPPSNLMKTNPLIQKTTPSVAPLPSKPTFENIGELATKPTTQVDTRNISGERIPYKQGKQYNAETGKWETSFSLNPSNPLAQQTQAAEDFRLKNLAYQNAQLANKGAAPRADMSSHAPTPIVLNPVEKMAQQAIINMPNSTPTTPVNNSGWEREDISMAMGGNMFNYGKKFREGDYMDVNNIYTPAANTTTTSAVNYIPMYARPNLNSGEFMQSLGYDIINADTDKEADEAAKKYQSELERLNTEQGNKNIDLNVEQGTVSGIAQLGPVAYNLGMGLFGNPEYINAEDYMMKQSATPWEYNIQPQINAARETFVQGQEALKNMSPGAGAYLTNLRSLADQRNKTFAELYGQKQNLDAAAYERAAAVNRQIAQQNIATKLQGLEYNQALKGRKQDMLKEGIKQMAQLGLSKDQTDLQLRYLGAVSPDFAGTASYTSFLDKMFAKAQKDKKENKETEKNKKS